MCRNNLFRNTSGSNADGRHFLWTHSISILVLLTSGMPPLFAGTPAYLPPLQRFDNANLGIIFINDAVLYDVDNQYQYWRFDEKKLKVQLANYWGPLFASSVPTYSRFKAIRYLGVYDPTNFLSKTIDGSIVAYPKKVPSFFPTQFRYYLVIYQIFCNHFFKHKTYHGVGMVGPHGTFVGGGGGSRKIPYLETRLFFTLYDNTKDQIVDFGMVEETVQSYGNASDFPSFATSGESFFSPLADWLADCFSNSDRNLEKIASMELQGNRNDEFNFASFEHWWYMPPALMRDLFKGKEYGLEQ